MKKYFHMHIKGYKFSPFGLFSRLGKNPFIDWFMILAVSFLAAAIFVYCSVSEFIYINSDAVSSVDQSVQPKVGGTLDEPDLVKLTALFQTKQANTALYSGQYQEVSDPSILPASSSVAAPGAFSSPSPAATSSIKKYI